MYYGPGTAAHTARKWRHGRHLEDMTSNPTSEGPIDVYSFTWVRHKRPKFPHDPIWSDGALGRMSDLTSYRQDAGHDVISRKSPSPPRATSYWVEHLPPTCTSVIMAARQLAGRRPLYFTADVSIILFSPSNLGDLWTDRHQTLPHVRWWL